MDLFAVEIKHRAVVDEEVDLQLAATGRRVEVKHLTEVKRGGPHLERGGHFVFLPGRGAAKVRLAAWPSGVVVLGLAPGGAEVFAVGVVPPLRVLEGNEIRRLGVAAVAEAGLGVGERLAALRVDERGAPIVGATELEQVERHRHLSQVLRRLGLENGVGERAISGADFPKGAGMGRVPVTALERGHQHRCRGVDGAAAG